MRTLEQLKQELHGFIDENNLPELIKISPSHLVLVRCGSARFICPAMYVDHMVGIIDGSEEDYVRDVSFLPTDSRDRLTM